MTSSKSAKVPKGWEAFYAGMTGMTDRFCAEHPNDEYADLARSAIAALCRKRPSPLAGGNPQTWACAVLYALGQVNFLSDKSTTPHMAMADLCTHFGTAPSTGGNKAKLVRAALGMRQFDHKWTLPSRLADSSLPWLITVDGLVVDARRLPMAILEWRSQKASFPMSIPRPARILRIPFNCLRDESRPVAVSRTCRSGGGRFGCGLLRVHPVRGRLGLAGRGENC